MAWLKDKAYGPYPARSLISFDPPEFGKNNTEKAHSILLLNILQNSQ